MDRTAARFARAFAALFTLTASLAGAGTYRLSQGLPFSDISYFQELSPDGRYVVYVQDAVVDEAFELWSAPVAGGDPVRLSGLLPAGAVIFRVAISPDSQRVVYSSAQETAGKHELYSIAIDGPEGSWIKLSGSLPADHDASNPYISPDSARVVYSVEDGNDLKTLWTVPIGGGTPIRLRPAFVPLGSGARTDGIQISPDSQRVVFGADYIVVGRVDLWSARVDGTGSPIRLSPDLGPGGGVYTGYRISDDSARVVYLALLDGSSPTELFSVPIAGGAAVQLNGALVSGGEVSSFEIASGSSRVVYSADQQTDEVEELYSVPIAGGSATKLSGPLVSGGDVLRFGVAPDGGRAVYIADQEADELDEIYSVPVLGGSRIKLNDTLPVQGDVANFEIAPDSSRVIYLGDQRVNDVAELFSIPIAGGTRVRVSDDPVPAGDVVQFRIAPTSDSVAFVADLQTDEKFELYRAEIASTAHADILLSGPMVAQGDVERASKSDLKLHPDGRQVVYKADAENPDQIELYVGDPCLLCDGFEAGFVARWE